MKNQKNNTYLILAIVLLSAICTCVGIFSFEQNKDLPKVFTSIYGNTFELYGKGIYARDSVSLASQAIAQDIVTLCIAIPLLLIGLFWSKKNLKGDFLLIGTLGYFAYTYTSYAFTPMYNRLFLLYVVLMSLSIFTLVINLNAIFKHDITSIFNKSFKYKTIGYFSLFVSIGLLFMWLGRILPSLITNIAPEGLEYYTTLGIQALDIGFVIPLGFFAGILTIKKKPLGYLLATIFIIKGLTLTLAISVMVIAMIMNGVSVSLIEICFFPCITLGVLLIIRQLFAAINPKY